MVGFANADGGRIAVGIHNGQVEGINSSPRHFNDLLQATIDHSEPPVRHAYTLINCLNAAGQPDRVLLLDVEASEGIHRSRRQECFLRVGDENRRLSLAEERELMFDKSEAKYDKTIVEDLTRDDLDMAPIEEYATQYKVKSVDALMRTRGLYVETLYRQGVTQAAWLLFGKVPPIWSYVRYLRYDGLVAETGSRSNLTKDVRLEGPIPAMIEQAKSLINDELQVIRLARNGRFQAVPALPEFAWLEAVVNAVTHRSYNLYGDGIRVKQFTDRLEVESPGRLPGLVRVQNIRNSRFARNPHIARVLAETTDYVRESNEGVKRMFEEMEQSGLRPPEYNVTESSVRVTLFKQPGMASAPARAGTAEAVAQLERRLGAESVARLLAAFKQERQLPTRRVALLLGVSDNPARTYMERWEAAGLVQRKRNSITDPASVWAVTEADFWL